MRRIISRTAVDLTELLNMNANRFFKQKSMLNIYNEADWLPDRIADEDLHITSFLALFRIGQTKPKTDAATGKNVVENTALVRRAKAAGIEVESLNQISEILARDKKFDENAMKAFKAATPLPDYTIHKGTPGRGSKDRITLDVIKSDLIADISSEIRPLSSLNYVFVTVLFMMLFIQIEGELKQRRHPLWVEAYEKNKLFMKEKRASLTLLVLQSEDEECMEIIAKAFEDSRTGWMSHMYWDDLDDTEKIGSRLDGSSNRDPEPSCSVM